MIGVVVPAHDEEALIGRCLAALRAAADRVRLAGDEVALLVVLDACRDATAEVAAAHGVETLAIDARNVGAARRAGAHRLIERGVRWLAFTDADSEVDEDWLVRQLASPADVVCGVVAVDDWSGIDDAARAAYEAAYVDAEEHRHIHGANLGVSTSAYLQAGGFPALRTHEDVALVSSLMAMGASIRWTNTVRVRTSARRIARAPQGFAAYLDRLIQANAATAAAMR